MLLSHKAILANSVDPDQTPQNGMLFALNKGISVEYVDNKN